MSITTTDTQTIANEPISLDEAKFQLGVTDNLNDADITKIIFRAREEAESYCDRTLRLAVSRVRTYDGWPSCMRFDHPPLASVDAVKYYDVDNAQQTLAASNYIVRTPTDGRGDLTWSRASGTTLPALFDRIDSVSVEYTTGWTTAAEVPEQAKAAILMLVNSLYDHSEFKEAEAYRFAAMRMLHNLDWGSYE